MKVISSQICGCIICIILFFETNAQVIEKLRINPAISYGGNASEYIKTIEYIPLETTKESLFGAVSEMLITDSSFIISDLDTKALLFFTRSGRFLQKIKGKIVYPSAWLDKKSNTILVCNTFPLTDPHSIPCIRYSLSGKKLQSLSLTRNELDLIRGIDLGNEYTVTRTNYDLPVDGKIKDTTLFLISTYKGGSLYKRIFPFNTLEHQLFFKQNRSLNIGSMSENGSVYVVTPFDHFLYKVSKDKVTPMYQFVFPANRTLPRGIIESKDSRVIDSVQKILAHDQNIIVNVKNIIFNGKKMYFNAGVSVYPYSDLGSGGSNQFNFIYDLNSGKLTSFERFTPDSTTCYLPFTSLRSRYWGMDYFDGFFYTNISSLNIFAAKGATKSKNPNYPPVLQEYFNTQNSRSNPVIVKMKLKE
ncbi:hypothetical protein A3860_33055 [Niastella vici]|uniref:6-bladed beta-propeller n=1 Tax=Niastella vici TaxID=1703345 RepID=A0A1V9FQC7_9BACT|nr:6-bladed beta-propeller [Niastella vici]OQP60497.1 hypothetical protein A3860_33055 [Niastella vici]